MSFAASGSSRPLTALLAETVAAAPDREISGEQYAAVRRILIDWLGVALVGSAEPVARIVEAEFGREEGAASVLGGAMRASPCDAALINGTAGHALDYDDVHEYVGHPGAVVVPAALAVAEAVGADAEQFVRAVITGYDAAYFVGSLVMPGHYDRGFHSTATVGTFGSSMSAAVLMGLDGPEIKAAIGLAATQAAGLKSMFGTMAKPFHAGRAASAGVTAARLAARGLTANSESLETEQGFLATQANQAAPDGWTAPKFGQGLAGVQFKYHASCYLTHSTIEAVRSLVREHSPAPRDIVGVIIEVPDGHLKVCNIDEPQTGLEAKFSLRQVAALALAGHDTSDIGIFSDDLAKDTGLQLLRSKVHVAGGLAGLFAARVTIDLADGRSIGADADISVAETPSAEMDGALDRKFLALTSPLLGIDRAQELIERSYDPRALCPRILLPYFRTRD